MIVRPRPHWIHLLFVRRGSLIRLIWQQQLFIVLWSCAVVWVHGQLFLFKVTLNSSPFSLMGVALAIFLGFRINASYDRYWEARKHWGAVLVEARNLARLALASIAPPQDVRPFVLGLIAFATGMRNQLRGQPAATGTEGLLPPEVCRQLEGARSGPTLTLLWLARWLQDRQREGCIDGHKAQTMDTSLNALSMAFGSCERIANTPLPFTYSVILHRSAYVYCTLLPFGLVDSIGWMTPLVVSFVSYTFFALEALSDEIEEPFGLRANDLALDAMTAGIEAGLREMLGEVPPPPMRPDTQYRLS
ncbi:bestrophin family protein [Xylophilus sp. GOD-11R]|uniref:bestrophin family protein n=1 Tax=Xylophilus sp. GOD-11R TaxID=3089814 RepID=UPI00298C095A|nr:bestrophin family ion channel [Xylophilus sp. GOD-11R]WPB55735.1 bestrophin family ion channel [Xylophilus sp. GOD-11R]